MNDDSMLDPPTGLLAAYDKDRKCMISNVLYNPLFNISVSPYVKMSNKYKLICMCEIYVMERSVQKDLNEYKLPLIQRLDIIER